MRIPDAWHDRRSAATGRQGCFEGTDKTRSATGGCCVAIGSVVRHLGPGCELTLRWLNLLALSLALSLPVVVTVLVGLARLLAALGDAGGARWVDRACLALGVGWLLSLVALVVLNSLLLNATSAQALGDPVEPESLDELE